MTIINTRYGAIGQMEVRSDLNTCLIRLHRVQNGTRQLRYLMTMQLVRRTRLSTLSSTETSMEICCPPTMRFRLIDMKPTVRSQTTRIASTEPPNSTNYSFSSSTLDLSSYYLRQWISTCQFSQPDSLSDHPRSSSHQRLRFLHL